MLKTLNLLIVIPFIFSLILGCFSFIKNPIYIRRFAKSIFFFEFILGFLALIFFQDTNFSLFGVQFSYDKFSSYLIFLSILIFFLFSIISKTFISKLHRLFYASSLLLMGLVNVVILSDNVFVALISLFWIFLLYYLLSTSFSKSEGKKNILAQLMSDLFWYLVALFLISKDFIRLFVVNDIEFNFSLLAQNMYKIDDLSIMLAFVGFLILIGRLFNLIPFCAKNLSNSNTINPLVYFLQGFSSLVLACFLFVKCYLNFNFMFYQMQDIIALFLLVNFVIFVVLSVKQNNIFKFLVNIFSANVIIGLFSVFAFEQECFRIFAYFIFVLCVAYATSVFALMILSEKFKTDRFDELKRINDKSRLFQFFITTSLLNIASVPVLSFFGAELICFMMIFATEYDGVVLNIAPYVLIIGAFALSAGVFNSLYRILIEPPEKSISLTNLSSHQVFVFGLLVFMIIILSFCPSYIFNQIGTVVNIGNF